MSTCRIYTHRDTGVPSLLSYKRNSLYQFLDTLMLDGYNVKYVHNFVRDGRNVTLNYSEAHGYKIGQLLTIADSSAEEFNGGLFRVISVPTATSLTIYLKDDSYVNYPEMSTETTMTSKVAPLGWEKVFESPTQRSYRSRRQDSSKIVITVKEPTFHATKLKTTNAVAYEVDFSKDIDIVTGSPIDSCFTSRKAQYGHTCNYWVTCTNSDNIAEATSWSNDVYRAPFTIVGDDKMVYIITQPYVDGVYEQGTRRQWDPLLSWNNGSYRHNKIYAFGDYEPLDENEYLTGSSFYFKFYYYVSTSSFESYVGSSEYNPFIQLSGSTQRYEYFFSEYDPTGVCANARVVSGGCAPYEGYNYSCSGFIWSAYPERVAGGIVYYPFYAYNNAPSTGVNNVGTFLKGTFPYVRVGATSLRNLGNAYAQHARIFDTDKPTVKLFTHSNSVSLWTENDVHYGAWLFELD